MTFKSIINLLKLEWEKESVGKQLSPVSQCDIFPKRKSFITLGWRAIRTHGPTHTHTHRWWEGGNWTSSGFTCLGASRSQPTGPEPRARNRLGCENPRKTSCPPCETFCGGPSLGGRWGGLRRPFQAVAWKIVSCTRWKFARMGTYHKGKGIRQVVGAKVTWRVFFFFGRGSLVGRTSKSVTYLVFIHWEP